MTFLLELKDDLVLISTWETASNSWYCWGSVHFDAFCNDQNYVWQEKLKQDGRVIVTMDISVNYKMSLPPDNLS